jgi:hypothetical protein
MSAEEARSRGGGLLDGSVDRARLEQVFRSGAGWFYWIGAMSLLNSVIQWFDSDRLFLVGLGITQAIDGIAAGLAQGLDPTAGAVVRGLAMGLDVVAAGAFASLGWLAREGKPWAFVVGMAAYFVDGLVFLLVQFWPGIGFHALALFFIWRGYGSLARMREAEGGAAPAVR